MKTSEIAAVIQTYFDASYEGSGEKMREVFHSAAHVYGHSGSGALNDMDKETFASLVESSNHDPNRSGYPRQEEILAIEFTGENTAVARVKLRVRDTAFTDVLSFIRIDGRWSIISKLLSGVPVG